MTELKVAGFSNLEENELTTVDGGVVILGTVVSGMLLAKIFAGGATAGIAVAGVYYSQK